MKITHLLIYLSTNLIKILMNKLTRNISGISILSNPGTFSLLCPKFLHLNFIPSISRIFECRAKLVRNLNSSKLSTKTRQINLLAIFAGYRDMYSFFCLNRFDISSSSPPQPQNMFEKPLTWRNWSTVMAETPPNMSS